MIQLPKYPKKLPKPKAYKCPGEDTEVFRINKWLYFFNNLLYKLII